MEKAFKSYPGRRLIVSEAILCAYIAGETKLGADMAVYLQIIRSSLGKDGYCWATNEFIANSVRLSKRQVIDSIKNLESIGVVQIKRNGNERKIYPLYDGGKSEPQCTPEGGRSEPRLTVGVNHGSLKDLDTGVSKLISKRSGEAPPPKIYQKTPDTGLVELNGESSSVKEKKPVLQPSKEAMAVARELREAIRSVRRWIPAASSNKRWAIELTKLAKRKSPTDLSKGWATIRSTIKLIHYANHHDYKQPDFDDAFTFCRFFNWITQSLQDVRHSGM